MDRPSDLNREKEGGFPMICTEGEEKEYLASARAGRGAGGARAGAESGEGAGRRGMLPLDADFTCCAARSFSKRFFVTVFSLSFSMSASVTS